MKRQTIKIKIHVAVGDRMAPVTLVLLLCSAVAPAAALCATPSTALPSAVQRVVDTRFRRPAPPDRVAALWTELQECYGCDDRALQAIQQNPQVLNPAYTNPPSVIPRSKAILVEKLGDERAMAAMQKNPAVLQCGTFLKDQSAAEIEFFANVRQVLDGITPEGARTSVLGVTALVLLAATSRLFPDVQILQDVTGFVRPVLGLVFGSLFVVAASNAVRANVKGSGEASPAAPVEEERKD